MIIFNIEFILSLPLRSYGDRLRIYLDHYNNISRDFSLIIYLTELIGDFYSLILNEIESRDDTLMR